MTLLDAHGSIFGRPDSWIVEAHHDGVDVSAAATTALAKLSGRLDECESADDLDEAAAHGLELYQNGRFGMEDVDAATRLVLCVVLEFGRQR